MPPFPPVPRSPLRLSFLANLFVLSGDVFSWQLFFRMLRNSETLGVGFVWVTLTFFCTLLMIFFCLLCRFLLLFENFRIFKLQITEKFRLVQLVCASSGSLMHSSLPSFFSSSPHSCIRLIDFLISLLIFLAMSFEFSPKITHTLTNFLRVSSLFSSLAVELSSITCK